MRYYSNNAPLMQLTANINASVTTITVGPAVAGLPTSTPFTLVIDEDLPTQELVEVTNISGTTLTVTRGVDNTTAIDHTVGAEVKHDSSARDFLEPQLHIAASSGVHGVVSRLVGADDTQTLTNKSISGLTNNLTDIPVNVFQGPIAKSFLPSDTIYAADTNTLTNKVINGANNTLTVRDADITGMNANKLTGTNTAPKGVLPTDTVFKDDVQTLTQKTISGSSNNFSNIPGTAITGSNSVAKAVLPADVVYDTDTGNVAGAAASGFGSANVTVRTRNGVAYVNFGLVRTGADIGPATSGGDIGDTVVATIPSGFPARLIYTGGRHGGTKTAMFSLDASGNITLIAMGAGETLSTGDSLAGNFTYLV